MGEGVIEVTLVRGEEQVPCNCGCGMRHRAYRGQAARAGGAEKVLFYVLMTECGPARNLWFAVGSGPWDPEVDPRSCFCSVQVWYADGSVRSSVTDAARSPWRFEPIFTDRDHVARLLDREEVMGRRGAPEWLFSWTDDLSKCGLPRLGRFLFGLDD